MNRMSQWFRKGDFLMKWQKNYPRMPHISSYNLVYHLKLHKNRLNRISDRRTRLSANNNMKMYASHRQSMQKGNTIDFFTSVYVSTKWRPRTEDDWQQKECSNGSRNKKKVKWNSHSCSVERTQTENNMFKWIRSSKQLHNTKNFRN